MQTYENPILNADFSDPDVVRDQDRYYMISSTIQMVPGMTLLESRDLVHWHIIGSILPHPEQFHPFLSSRKMGAYGKGVYAGSLRRLEWKEEGTHRTRVKWFVYTTIFQAGILVSTADSVYGPWTTQFMRDKNGEELVSPFLKTEEGLALTAADLESLEIPALYWDDNCPYWEFREDGTLKAAYLVASKPGVYALERAKNAGIEGIVLARSDYENVDAYSEALENLLKEKHTDLIVLAGFMTITNEKFTKAFENKIINVHPALIPSFCGKGYYGLHVHEAALARGVKVSGATVHFVNEVCDGGPIILQKAVPVEQGDTPETLQRRIMEQAEWKILPQAVSLFCAGKLSVNGSIVTIKE